MLINNLIFPYDYILFVIILMIIIYSFWRGFIQSILGLLTWIGSILITIYSYQSFANFITSQLLNFEFFKNNEYPTNIFGIIIAIPIIFLISLFILKKVRKFLSSDLDKQILGIILDKFFGFIYGIIFSYVVITAIIILFNRFDLVSLNEWSNNNSYIFSSINEFNQKNFNLLPPIENIEY